MGVERHPSAGTIHVAIIIIYASVYINFVCCLSMSVQ